MSRRSASIEDQFLYNGFFSEYLPEEFGLRMAMKKSLRSIPRADKIDFVDPLVYTMARSNESRRRVMHVPELTAYLSAVEYMQGNRILEECIKYSDEDLHSFSKLARNGELVYYDVYYDIKEEHSTRVDGLGVEESDFGSTYISNMIEKIRLSRGSIGILKIDIANFFGSIYTHFFPSIPLGFETADQQFHYFRANQQDSNISDDYKRYVGLDEKVRQMNQNRSIGLLVGPLISKFIAEALLSRIDVDLESRKLKFTRFMDDYEFIVYSRNEIAQIEAEVTAVFHKYRLSINNEKTLFIDFPSYSYANLAKLISEYSSMGGLDDEDVVELMSSFFAEEKNGVQGAVRYLLKRLGNMSFRSKNAYVSYLLSLLVNDARSISYTCKQLLGNKSLISEEDIAIIVDVLEQKITTRADLESIWIFYLLCKLNKTHITNKLKEQIVQSDNDLLKIILLEEFQESIDESILKTCVDDARSWMLLYQLFLHDKISEDDFKIKSGISRNSEFYAALKKYKFSFYGKQES